MAKGKNRQQFIGMQGSIVSDRYTDWDFIYRASTDKDPLYNLGDKVDLPDGRRFRYAYAGAECYGGQLCQFYNAVGIAYTTLAAVQAIGDKSITIASQTLALDVLRGGYVVIYGSTNADVQQRGIIGNSVASSSTVTIYLDGALTAAVTASTGVEVLKNPYSDLRTQSGQGPGGYSSNAGVAASVAAATYYFWVQTWGPCWIPPGEAGVGGISGERQLVAGNDGSLHPHSADYATTLQLQHVGFIIQRDSSGSDGPPFIMLQIS